MQKPAKMNEWRPREGSTDIVIEVDNTKFHCHRAVLATASNYFHTMFNSLYWDSTSKTISLDRNFINAQTFEDILTFIYHTSRKVRITMENVCFLLIAADYLQLKPEVEKVFTDFIEKNLPNPYMFDVANFAERTGKHSLFYNMTDYISCHLHDYSKTSDFLESPLEVIKMIIDLSTMKEEIVVDSTMQWINHKHEERWKCFSQLSCLGMMACVPHTKIEFMAESLIPDKISNEDVISYLEQLKRPSIDETLRVYWIFHNFNRRDLFEISIYQHKVNCNIFQMKDFCGGTKKVVWDRSIFYSLNYIGLYTNLEGGFGSLEFRSCTLDGGLLKILKTHMETNKEKQIYYSDFIANVHLFGLPNLKEIYLYNALERSLHVYHCDTDEWNEIKLENRGSWATIATCETSNTLYTVGGETGDAYLIAYDCCSKKWRDNLPNPNRTYFGKAAMCVFNEKLYLYNESDRVFEIYDPSTNEWRVSKPNPHMKAEFPERIVAYGDELWLFAGDSCINVKSAYIAYLYRPESNSWRKYPLIMKTMEQEEGSFDLNTGELRFLDTIVY